MRWDGAARQSPSPWKTLKSHSKNPPMLTRVNPHPSKQCKKRRVQPQGTSRDGSIYQPHESKYMGVILVTYCPSENRLIRGQIDFRGNHVNTTDQDQNTTDLAPENCNLREPITASEIRTCNGLIDGMDQCLEKRKQEKNSNRLLIWRFFFFFFLGLGLCGRHGCVPGAECIYLGAETPL